MTTIQTIKTCLAKFRDDQSGLSAVEYGLLAAGIAIGLYVILADIGVDLRAIFNSVKGNLNTAATGA
jgi:pilus assembly protein Flp/PilA